MKISETAKKMVCIIGVSSFVFILAGAVYYRSLSALPFALGVLLTSALNALKILLLERTVEKAVVMEEQGAANYVRLQYFLRFMLTGLVLIAAALLPFISLWGAVAGTFTLQIAAYAVKFFLRDGKNADDSH